MGKHMMVIDVSLRIPKSDDGLIAALLEDPDLNSERFQGSGIDGGGELVTIIVGLTTASLTALVAILRARWARSQTVKIEVDGIKVEGSSPDEIHALLERLLVERQRREASDSDNGRAD